MLVLFEFAVASILSSILLLTAYAVLVFRIRWASLLVVCSDRAKICCVCHFIPRRSMVVVDQAISRSVSKIIYFPDYEGSVIGSLRCFLRVLGRGGLAVVWPRAFPLSICYRGPFGQSPCYY
ncbi:hypothetical protein F2Q70_00005865 [Brassica cretica]|uniref:Uncharacterized protein n=1 Tax=Brassica cretica TaxID=69181 RepID=A0A8S9J3T4_BRACR|nr:hypothetical protein F2Q70_00005865 [Brassica cretica]